LEKVANDLDLSILVDYAHTPDALEKVLAAVRPLSRRKVLTVFGCGGDRDRGKRPLMGEIAARLSDLVVLTSDNPRTEDPLAILREVESGVRKTGLPELEVPASEFRVARLETDRGYWVEADRRQAIRIALKTARPGDLVLIAGKGHDREVAREESRRIKHESHA
jgi:UDP-N-acetylmuramoyl-L-alanyl-D-glutamate--2,6-diaminopimelate ligase